MIDTADWMGGTNVLAGRHYSVDVWDAQTATRASSMKNANRIVNGVSTFPDSSLVAVSQNSASGLSVWDMATHEVVATMSSDYPICVAVVDANHVVVGLRGDSGRPGKAHVWNWREQKKVASLRHGAPGTSVTAVGVLADGTILTGGNDGGMRLFSDWREKSKPEGRGELWFGTTPGQIKYINALDDSTFTAGAWTSEKDNGSGKRIGTVNNKLRIWTWNGDSFDRVASLVGHTNQIRDAAFLNEEMVVSVAEDAQAKVWNWKTGECMQHIDLPSCWGNAVSAHNSTFAVVSQPVLGQSTGVTTISVFGLPHGVKRGPTARATAAAAATAARGDAGGLY